MKMRCYCWAATIVVVLLLQFDLNVAENTQRLSRQDPRYVAPASIRVSKRSINTPTQEMMQEAHNRARRSYNGFPPISPYPIVIFPLKSRTWVGSPPINPDDYRSFRGDSPPVNPPPINPDDYRSFRGDFPPVNPPPINPDDYRSFRGESPPVNPPPINPDDSRLSRQNIDNSRLKWKPIWNPNDGKNRHMVDNFRVNWTPVWDHNDGKTRQIDSSRIINDCDPSDQRCVKREANKALQQLKKLSEPYGSDSKKMQSRGFASTADLFRGEYCKRGDACYEIST